MSVFESVLADGTMAARSPERSIRHIPFLWQLKRTLHDARDIRKCLMTCAAGRSKKDAMSETGLASRAPSVRPCATVRVMMEVFSGRVGGRAALPPIFAGV
jgi:hypothetical protein